jgi:tetratricopeptide (TPR) repeat protein/tRNA A-37 threonylcarbamoyl transferase component Bud32
MQETSTPVLYGKYQLLEQLARGGMAEVFKAKAHGVECFEKILVIKRILPELSQNPRFVEMFINEAKIAVTLSHANIVQVFDLGQAQDSYFIAMEFVAGMDLATTLRLAQRAQRRLDPELAVYIVSELAKGLDYAHRRRDSEQRLLNLVHRDVSPQNVLLSNEGEVKLTDFGIAKARTLAQSVTDVGVIKGKYAYMSPEQLLGRPVDARADVFAAGVLLYETLSGSNPFQTGSNYDTLQRIRSGEVTPIEQLVSDVPPEVSRVVRTAMAYEPEHRYRSAGHLYEDLIQYLYGTGRRFGARDLGAFLSELRSGCGEEQSRTGDGLKAAFEVDSVTGFDDPLPERTRVGRGRRNSREAALLAKKGREVTPHRERTEWRDVTALSLRRAPDDELQQKSINYIVERFGGQLVSEVPGPGIETTQVFLFGAQNPDGRDSQSAALCALRLARASSAASAESGRSTTVALGVTSGRVLVDLAGGLVNDEHHAALLAQAREFAAQSGSGQILVNGDGEKAMRNHFRLVPAGQQFEGAFLLASERSLAEVYGRFVGRRKELKSIGESLARASRGELRVIGLNGEPGAGKTRLLVETTRRLGLAGHNVGLHIATLTPQLRETPLSAIQAMLRAVLGVDEFDPGALLRDRTMRLRELGLLHAEQAAVASALGLETGGKSQTSTRPLRAALLRIIRKLAEDRLTIFAWDGAEHMDAESHSIMDDMLRSVVEGRVGVILGYRPPYRPGWSDLPNFVEIRLGMLGDEDIARLTATRLGADEIPLELLREVTTKSGGNPLYAEEHLKALLDSGAIHFEDGQVRFNAEVADVEVPKSLRGIVASRIGRLGPLQRYLLQVAAIAGERWNVEIVAAAAQEEPRSVIDAIHAREMQGIVQRVGPDEYLFAHGLVRQVVLESITVQARREINTAITEAIVGLYPNRLDEMAERLARHYLEAGQHDEAVDALVRAARRFESESANEEAIAALQRAADVLATIASPDRERMFKIYEELAELCFRNRDLELGAQIMQKALAAAEAHNADKYVARFCVWRGRMLVSASRIEEGRRWLDQAQHVARGLTDASLSRDVFIAKADADARSGEFENAIGALQEALALAQRSGNRLAQLRCLMPLALTCARMDDHASAMQTLERVKQLAGADSDALIEAQVLRLESQIHYHARDPQAVALAAAKAMEIAREANLFYECALNAHNMGEAFLRMGDFRRAFAALRNSYEIASEHGYTRLSMSNMRILGFIDATRFDSSEGRARLVQAIDYAIEHEFVWDIIPGKYLLAIVEQQRGEIESARAALREVLTLAVQHGHRKYTQDSEAALRELDAGLPIALPA